MVSRKAGSRVNQELGLDSVSPINGHSSLDPSTRLHRKLVAHLIPFLCLLYIANSVDRSNVGFARLSMQKDLHMSDAVFDIGYGIFYFGYLAFEVPANLLLRKVGARRWIARIMITWGLVSCLTLAVKGPISFYAVRILLGLAEAGFFPGIILYLTFWFPARERAKVTAYFMTAIPIAGLISNPLSGAIMHLMGGRQDLLDWQWLFLLEGIPSVLLGVVVLWFLPDGPEQARWLEPEERAWIKHRVQGEEEHRRQRHGADLLQAFRNPRVWLLICVYFTVAVGANAGGSYFPKLISEQFAGQNKFVIGLLGAAPYLCAILAMNVYSVHSDRTGERRGHVAVAAVVAASGWMLSEIARRPDVSSPWLGLLGLCIAQTGMMCMLPTFWAIPTSFLSGAAAAGGIALINSVANLGGLMGPWILGKFGLVAMAGTLAAGAILAMCIPHEPTFDKGLADAE